MNVYTILADMVVVVHLAYVGFVIFGLLAVLMGYLRRWTWVHNPWFRLVHLSMIGIVVVESLLSITCPLTTLEDYLRSQGGQRVIEEGSFVGRLAHELLFVNASPAFLTIAYCAFGLMVVAALFLVPIRWTTRALKDGV